MNYRISVAAVGLVLVVLLSLSILWWNSIKYNQRIIEKRYESYRTAIENRNYHDAYLMMSPDYRRKHSFEEYNKDPLFMDAPALSPNHSTRVYQNKAKLFPWPVPDWGELWSGDEYDWIKVDGQWYMTGEFTAYRD